MSDILHIPAGVIQPKPLLIWLRDQRDTDRELAEEYEEQGDDDLALESRASAAAYNQVIQHIQYGGAS